MFPRRASGRSAGAAGGNHSTPGDDQPSLVRNTIAQSAPLLLGYLYSFASAPIIVAGLGIHQFGIWALTGGIVQYVALLDAFGPPLSRFIAAHEGDRRACGQYMAIGLLSGLLVSGVAITAALVAAAPLSHQLGGISAGDMRTVAVSSAVLVLVGCVTWGVCAYPVGRRRMVAPNIGLAVGATLNFVASVGSILAGAGLPGYAVANAGAGLVSTVIVIGLVVKLDGPVPLAWPSRDRVVTFFSYASKFQFVRLANLIDFQTDKIVVGFSVGASAAGAYELANRVALAAREVGIYPTTALLPTLTSELNRFGLEHVRQRYARLAEVTAAFGLPALVLTAAVAPILLGAWLSHVPTYSSAVLAALAVAYIADVSSSVGSVVASAAGDPGIAARTAAGTALVNIVLTVALASAFGIWGVLAGTALSLTGGALVLVLLVHRRFSFPALAYVDAVLPPLRTAVLLAIPVAVVAYSHRVTGRGALAGALVVLSALYLAAYGVWVARAGRIPEKITRCVARAPGIRGPVLSRLVAPRSETRL
jgi:O-antigen/teichoic acid export membrane protein